MVGGNWRGGRNTLSAMALLFDFFIEKFDFSNVFLTFEIYGINSFCIKHK